MSKVSSKPEGYHTITPYLIVNDANKAIEFYQDVFDAKEKFRMGKPDGRIGHSEFTIGDSKFMLADEFPQMNALSPKTVGGTPVSLHLYVDDVDSVVEKAVKKGAILEQAVETRFYGDRNGTVLDPFGHRWNISTHVEDVSPEEVERRAFELYKGKKLG